MPCGLRGAKPELWWTGASSHSPLRCRVSIVLISREWRITTYGHHIEKRRERSTPISDMLTPQIRMRVKKKHQYTKFRLRALPQHRKVLPERGLHPAEISEECEGDSQASRPRTQVTAGQASRAEDPRPVAARCQTSPSGAVYKKHPVSCPSAGWPGVGRSSPLRVVMSDLTP